jgi:hypothetical protein
MECKAFSEQLDDYLDGQLASLQRRLVEGHLERCQTCRDAHRRALALQEALTSLSAPVPHPGFVEQALSRATRTADGSAVYRRRSLVSLALAATVLLGVTVTLFLAGRPVPAPVQTVTLALQRPETVRMMFTSAKPLKGAILSLGLPENVELIGYGDRRELSWKTDLEQGRNLLQLPLIVRGPAKDDLVASLSHGGSTKMFRLRIQVENAGGLGM